MAEKGFKVYGTDINKKVKIKIDKNIKEDEPKLNSLIKEIKTLHLLKIINTQ